MVFAAADAAATPYCSLITADYFARQPASPTSLLFRHDIIFAATYFDAISIFAIFFF
jgi:hypothetical protein